MVELIIELPAFLIQALPELAVLSVELIIELSALFIQLLPELITALVKLIVELPSLLVQAAVELGRLGGKAGKGKAKARTTEQARAAALVRWGKVRRDAVQKP